MFYQVNANVCLLYKASKKVGQYLKVDAWSWCQRETGPDHPHNAAIRPTQRTSPHRNQLQSTWNIQSNNINIYIYKCNFTLATVKKWRDTSTLAFMGQSSEFRVLSFIALSLQTEERRLTVCVSALTMSGCTSKYSRTMRSTSRISSTKGISRTSRLHKLTSAKLLFLLTDLVGGQNTQKSHTAPLKQ